MNRAAVGQPTMGNLYDYQNFERALAGQLEQIDASEAIADADKAALRRFVVERDGDLKTSSLDEYLTRARLTAERFDPPLVEMDHTDVQDAMYEYRRSPYGRDGDGMSEHSMRNYRKGLRVFFKWLGREWYEQIEIGPPPENTLRPEDMHRADDIAALRRAASCGRDVALVEFLADTGARLSMVGSLRVGDVDLDGDTATYVPNEEATGLKGADIVAYPVIDAAAPLRAYLSTSHPQPANDGAALFHVLVGPERDLADMPDRTTPVGPTQLAHRLTQIADAAGVDKPVNPHNFRHSAVSRMLREGFSMKQIEHRVHWSLDTRMWQNYVHVTAEEMNETIFEEVGLVDAADDDTPERRHCGTCNEINPPRAERCMQCGLPISEAAKRAKRTVEDDTIEDLADPDLSGYERRLVSAFLARVRNDELAPSPDRDHSAPPSKPAESASSD